jgi:hypothetical protein
MDVEADEPELGGPEDDEETFGMPGDSEDIELEMDLERVREEFPDEFGIDVSDSPAEYGDPIDYDRSIDLDDSAPASYMEMSQDNLPSTIFNPESLDPEDVEYLKEIGYKEDMEESSDEFDNEIMVRVLRRTPQLARTKNSGEQGDSLTKCVQCNKMVYTKSGKCPNCGGDTTKDKKSSGQGYQPKTGEPCHCRPGSQRDNCRDCEGTGMKVDFKKIRDRDTTPPTKKSDQ